MTRDFNGTTDLINCGSGTTIDDIWLATNGGTFFCWNFPDTIGEGNLGRIYNKSINAVGVVIEIRATTKFHMTSERATLDGDWTQTNNDAILDAWNSLAIKYDAALITNDPTFCHNGIIQTVGSGLTEDNVPNGAQGSDAAQSQLIGNDTTSVRTWDGYISQMILWKGEAIGNIQMQAMSRGVNPFVIGSTRPVFLMPIWGNESPEFDLSGNNNDGTLTGTTTINTNPPVELIENYL